MDNTAKCLRYLPLIAILTCIGVAIFFVNSYSGNKTRSAEKQERQTMTATSSQTNPTSTTEPSPEKNQMISSPIANASGRVTKKPFGLHVLPDSSPVTPEKFSGYHTGVDFETTEEEKFSDIEVSTICDGPLETKEWASGYGGLAIQRCVIDGEAVTVMYGHLSLASIDAEKGAQLKAGDTIGLLGQGYTSETDGERKHLHLGIHKGESIDILGYVFSRSSLSRWIDPMTLMGDLR